MRISALLCGDADEGVANPLGDLAERLGQVERHLAEFHRRAIHRESVIDQLHAEFPMAVLSRDRIAPCDWTASIESCQREDPLLAKLPLEFRVRIFQAKIWKTLAGRNG